MMEQSEELIGRVYVKVHGGRNLVSKDKSGRADAYIRVTYNKTTILTSKVSPKTLDPKWGEDVTVAIEAPLEALSFEVLNAAAGQDSAIQGPAPPSAAFLGMTSLRLSEFSDQAAKQAWYPLKKTQANQQVAGEVEISVQIKFNAVQTN